MEYNHNEELILLQNKIIDIINDDSILHVLKYFTSNYLYSKNYLNFDESFIIKKFKYIHSIEHISFNHKNKFIYPFFYNDKILNMKSLNKIIRKYDHYINNKICNYIIKTNFSYYKYDIDMIPIESSNFLALYYKTFDINNYDNIHSIEINFEIDNDLFDETIFATFLKENVFKIRFNTVPISSINLMDSLFIFNSNSINRTKNKISFLIYNFEQLYNILLPVYLLNHTNVSFYFDCNINKLNITKLNNFIKKIYINIYHKSSELLNNDTSILNKNNNLFNKCFLYNFSFNTKYNSYLFNKTSCTIETNLFQYLTFYFLKDIKFDTINLHYTIKNNIFLKKIINNLSEFDENLLYHIKDEDIYFTRIIKYEDLIKKRIFNTTFYTISFSKDIYDIHSLNKIISNPFETKHMLLNTKHVIKITIDIPNYSYNFIKDQLFYICSSFNILYSINGHAEMTQYQ